MTRERLWAVVMLLGMLTAAGLQLSADHGPIAPGRQTVIALDGSVLPGLTGCVSSSASPPTTIVAAAVGGYVPGIAALSRGDWTIAAQMLEAAYEAQPRDLTAAVLGALHWRLGERDLAARWWSRSAQSVDLLVALARGCATLRQDEAAGVYLRLAAEHLAVGWKPAYADVITFLTTSGSADDLDRALQQMDLQAKYEHIEGLYAAGWALLRQNRPAEAARYFVRVVETDGGDFNAMRLAAQAEFGAGNLDAARNWVGQVLALPTDHQRDYFLMGQIADRAGQLDEAYRWFEQAGGVKALLNQARIRIRQGRDAEAADIYRAVMELEPSNVTAMESLRALGQYP